MKRNLYLIGTILMLLFAFTYCGGEEVPAGQDISGGCDHYTGEQIIVKFGPLFQSADPPPGLDWVLTQPNTGQVDGVGRVVFFYATAEGADPTQAESLARAMTAGQLADAVKMQVIHQFAEAREAIGVGTDQDIEAVSQSLIATRSRVEVSGLMDYGMPVTMEMVEIGNVDLQSCEETSARQRFYRAIVCKYVEYNTYIELRDGIVNGADRGQLNEQQQRLMDRCNDALADLDSGEW